MNLVKTHPIFILLDVRPRR